MEGLYRVTAQVENNVQSHQAQVTVYVFNSNFYVIKPDTISEDIIYLGTDDVVVFDGLSCSVNDTTIPTVIPADEFYRFSGEDATYSVICDNGEAFTAC